MTEDSLLAFKTYAGMISVYEALPHRPVVIHVPEELAMGDACLAFFDSLSASSSSPFLVEVLNSTQPNAHLTIFDLLSYLSIARSSVVPGSNLGPVLDWTVGAYLDTKVPVERIVLDIISSEGEASILQAMKMLLSCSPEQKHLPIVTVSESKLRSIFGYVTLSQIMAAILVNSQHQETLFFTTVHANQGCSITLTLFEEQSLGAACDLLLSERLSWLAVVDATGSIKGALSIEHVVKAISGVFAKDGDILREFHSSVKDAMSSYSDSEQTDSKRFVGYAKVKDFPMTIKDVLKRLLVTRGSALVVLDDDNRPISTFSVDDVLRIVLSLNQIAT